MQRAQDDLMVYDKAADDAIFAKLAARRERFIDDLDAAASSSAPQQGKYSERSKSQDPSNFGPDHGASERSQIA
eukprot:3178340-Heterocapsa_arctica.AAC.1